jgi:hypothetical protein
MTSPIEKLLISPPTQPDNPAWSHVAHAMDDLVRRAAWHSLTLGFRGGQTEADRERHLRQRQACIDGAKKIAADNGWTLAMSIEAQVELCEKITERAHKEWCDAKDHFTH